VGPRESYRLVDTIRINGDSYPQVLPMKGSSSWREIKRMDGLIIGKEEIVSYCEEKDLQAHAQWIKELNYPYKFPKMNTVYHLLISKKPIKTPKTRVRLIPLKRPFGTSKPFSRNISLFLSKNCFQGYF
jgi:hypothetical protein